MIALAWEVVHLDRYIGIRMLEAVAPQTPLHCFLIRNGWVPTVPWNNPFLLQAPGIALNSKLQALKITVRTGDVQGTLVTQTPKTKPLIGFLIRVTKLPKSL